MGGLFYLLLVGLILALAGWEFASLFHADGYHTYPALVSSGVVLLTVTRDFWGFDNSGALLSLVLFGSLVFYLRDYERGQNRSASDYSITIAGILYVGWLGAYLISLRALPDGRYWLYTALPAVWLADTGAYLVGKRFGRHRFTHRLSPKKSWEGYFGGIVFSVIGTALLCGLMPTLAGDTLQGFTAVNGATLGLVVSVLAPLGDLGESMVKRQVGMKDSGNILPGHGGVFDRIDSWLWAVPLAYYLITWVFI